MRLAPALSAVLVASFLTAAAAGAATPIASTESNVAGVTIDLMTLERKGNVLSVKWAVRNSGEKDANLTFQLGGQEVTTYLVDEENGTKYFVLTDKEDKVVASEHEYTSSSFGVNESLKSGETKRFWAKFPAPPAEVKSITVMFTQADPLEDVAITDK
jgi:hypothetical protein